ncbi:ATP-dependent protease [candidate division KSB1 bacterium]|nr:MAG: ATP-dependent protease [candidate division KSB1 bacterium]
MNKRRKFKEVPIELLRWRYDPEKIEFKTSDEVKPLDKIIGQERAIKAISIGLDIDSIGYNIFVTGLAGTGRSTTIKMALKGREKLKRTPGDICYVFNFKNPDSPRALYFPAGKGRRFKKDMEYFIKSLKKNIPQIFEGEQYKKRKEKIIQEKRDKEKKIQREFEKKIISEGFALVQLQTGAYTKPDIVPVIKDTPTPLSKLEIMVSKGEFPEKEFENLVKKQEKLINELEEIFGIMKNIEREIKESIAELDNQVVLPVIRNSILDLKKKYRNKKVSVYLKEVEEDLMQNLGLFQEPSEQAQGPFAFLAKLPQSDHFTKYEVNVIVDNSETRGAPIIIESFPSFKNLFGTIERVMDVSGQWRTDFTKIKAGSILKANGGYLIFNALDALLEPGVWQNLKRVLKNQKVQIQSYDPFYMFTTSALKPEEIECNTKVILIGENFLYDLLYYQDQEFKKVFKIKADFDSVMDNNDDVALQYAGFIKKICDNENLLPFDRSGIGAVMEYGVRIAGRQNKITTKFHYIADILREANYWAKHEKSNVVEEKHVEKAIKEKNERKKLLEDKIQELIEEGIILIDTEGEKVGQVNGLSVYNLGEYSFGKPSRITAETAMGKSGIINIEREADLSGRTHNKGVLIIGGYLRGKYAQNKPLTVSASLCFEQSYSGIDGDSASSTEIYAILSSLSGLPIRQDIAVTGSVNQKGEIQPIGGVNEKIEGFYDVCKARGLTGTQGVIIPYQNVKDLMLRKDIIETVKKGKFHIYPVKNVDEGIEILTGVPAGKRSKDGQYEKDTVNYLVDKKLTEFAINLKKYTAEEGKEF